MYWTEKAKEGFGEGELVNLLYHTSWDWLKPVVDKIEQLHEGVPQELINVSLFSRQHEVYNAVVEFIKWYNEQNRFICGVCGDHVNEYTHNKDKDVDECNNCK